MAAATTTKLFIGGGFVEKNIPHIIISAIRIPTIMYEFFMC